MSDYSKPIRDRIDEYLDDMMSPEDRRAFEAGLSSDPSLHELIDLQHRIERSIRELTAPPQLTAIHTDGILSSIRRASPPSQPWQNRLITPALALVLTACLIGAISVWQSGNRPNTEPYFETQSLVSIYDTMVERGFKPYYECRDPDRFSETFMTRQSKPLQLAEMPAGTRMLGLSYPGGLSRNTTAMLCEVDSRPVVVFVDRIETDLEHVMDQARDRNLSIHRKVLDGLVLYEITPLATARVMDLLVPTTH